MESFWLDWDVKRCSMPFNFAFYFEQAMEFNGDIAEDECYEPESSITSITPSGESSSIREENQIKRKNSSTQRGSHRRRKKQRRDNKATLGHRPENGIDNDAMDDKLVIFAPVDISSSPVTEGAYSSKNSKPSEVDKKFTKEELVENYGFVGVPWDGQ